MTSANVLQLGLVLMTFFCQWEAEDAQDVLDALTAKGMDDYIFTALYEIDMHINAEKLTGDIPYKPIYYLDPEYQSGDV